MKIKRFKNDGYIKTYFVYHESTGPNSCYYEIYKKIKENEDIIKMKAEYIYDIEEDDEFDEFKKSSTEFISYLAIPEKIPYVLYTSDNIKDCIDYLKTFIASKKYNI